MVQLGQGITKSNDWFDYANLGIGIDVDTSNCGFTETPHYLVTLEGETRQWCANGVNSIYRATPNGFRIYLRWTDDDGDFAHENPLRASHAKKFGWYLKWTGIVACQCQKK